MGQNLLAVKQTGYIIGSSSQVLGHQVMGYGGSYRMRGLEWGWKDKACKHRAWKDKDFQKVS